MPIAVKPGFGWDRTKHRAYDPVWTPKDFKWLQKQEMV